MLSSDRAVAISESRTQGTLLYKYSWSPNMAAMDPRLHDSIAHAASIGCPGLNLNEVAAHGAQCLRLGAMAQGASAGRLASCKSISDYSNFQVHVTCRPLVIVVRASEPHLIWLTPHAKVARPLFVRRTLFVPGSQCFARWACQTQGAYRPKRPRSAPNPPEGPWAGVALGRRVVGPTRETKLFDYITSKLCKGSPRREGEASGSDKAPARGLPVAS